VARLLSNADLALARICVGWPEARQTLRLAQEHFEAAGFSFLLEFLTRCISAVAVGTVYFEAGFDEVKLYAVMPGCGTTVAGNLVPPACG
jgi:hypothetical protein